MRRGPIPATGRPPKGSGVANPSRGPAASSSESSRRSQIPPLLDALERAITEFRLEFGKFFGGERPTPPDDLRNHVTSQLRNLRTMTIQAVADGFRLSNLEAQFNTHNELFNRRTRQREEGYRPSGAPRPRTPPPPRPDPEAGVRVDASLEPAAVAALYQGLYSGGAPTDLERFRGYLASQVDAIRQRTGCEAVVFRVASEDGRLKLKARPVATNPAAETTPESS